MKIRKVAVLGANGVMGRNISAIFASFGNAKVYLVSRTPISESDLKKCADSVRSDVVLDNMIPIAYNELPEYLNEIDLVFESVAESMDVKREVHVFIANSLSRNKPLICTGTSGNSIAEIANLYTEELREQVLGMHFFNPPYHMSLCELIPTEYTNPKVLKSVEEYLTEVLFRKVVIVKDTPAFLANRIGLYCINSALHYAEKYKERGGIDYIDYILGPFSGRAMPPLVTLDFIGLDTHSTIMENIYSNTKDYAHKEFVVPEYVKKLITLGKVGRKAGGGIYRKVEENGISNKYVYDISIGDYRKIKNYNFPFVNDMVEKIKFGNYAEAIAVLWTDKSEEARICLKALLEYIVYALYISSELNVSLNSVDDTMALGFNRCPPQALIEAFYGKENVISLYEKYVAVNGLSVERIKELFASVEKSKYDYRRYVKAQKSE